MPTRKAKRRVSALRGRAKSTALRIENELPPELRQYVRRVRQGLARLEKQVVSAQEGARRRFAHLLRETSQQLGRIEARGEREWRKRTTQARRDAVKLLRRLEKAIEPRRVVPARRKPVKRVVAEAVAQPVRRASAAVRAVTAPPTTAPAGPPRAPTPGSV